MSTFAELYTFEALAADHAARRGALTLPPAPPDPRLAAYDARIAETLTAQHQEMLSAATARGVSLTNRHTLDLRREARALARFFLRAFDLRSWPGADDFEPPVRLCLTVQEFVEARLARYHLSDALKAAAVQKITTAESDWEKLKMGWVGVYLPGQGCYLNGALLARLHQVDDPAALASHAPAHPALTRAALHEMLGHGASYAFTTLGQEKQALGLADYDFAQEFMARAVDSAAPALARLKNGLLMDASRYLEEGWAMWVSETLTAVLFNVPRRPAYTLTQVWHGVDTLALVPRDKAALRRLLTEIFLEPPADPADLIYAARALQSVSLHDQFRLGRHLAYVLGSVLADRMQANLGWRLMPHAMRLAGNVSLHPQTQSWREIHDLLYTPRLNPDWRWLALSALTFDHPPTLADLHTAARDQLNLAIPE